MFCSCFSASLVVQGPAAGPLGSEYFSSTCFTLRSLRPACLPGSNRACRLCCGRRRWTRRGPLPCLIRMGYSTMCSAGSPPGEQEPAVNLTEASGACRGSRARATDPRERNAAGLQAQHALFLVVMHAGRRHHAPVGPQVAPLRERANALRSLAEGLLLRDEHMHGMWRVLRKPREGVTMDYEDHVLIRFAICAERRPCQPITRARSSRTCLLLPTTVLLASELS